MAELTERDQEVKEALKKLDEELEAVKVIDEKDIEEEKAKTGPLEAEKKELEETSANIIKEQTELKASIDEKKA